MKPNLQIITAAVLSVAGLVLLFLGAYLAPQGEIHESILVAFGEIATFAGALFGIDAAYAKKLWEFTHYGASQRKEKPSAAHYTPSTKTSSQGERQRPKSAASLKMPTTSSLPETTA